MSALRRVERRGNPRGSVGFGRGGTAEFKRADVIGAYEFGAADGPRDTALVGGQIGLARINGRTARPKRDGLGWPAVVGECAEFGIAVLAVTRLNQEVVRIIAQVVAKGVDISARRVGVARRALVIKVGGRNGAGAGNGAALKREFCSVTVAFLVAVVP